MPRAASRVLLLLLAASCGRETTSAIDTVGHAGAVFERAPRLGHVAHRAGARVAVHRAAPARARRALERDRRAGRGAVARRGAAPGGLPHRGLVGAALLSAEKGYGRGFGHFDEEIDMKDQHTRTYRRTAEEVVERAIAHIAPPRAERDFFAARAEPSRFVSVDGIVSSQALYESGVRYADHHIGRLLAAWDATERGRAGLVVVTADHGEGLGEHRSMGHGFSNYEEQPLVPLVRPHAEGRGRAPGERRTFSDEELDRRGHIAALLEAWKASSEARALRADEADDEETRRMLDALGS